MKFYLLTFFTFVSFMMSAQEKYSYIHERIFEEVTDLHGYNFRPYKMETSGDYEATEIEAGEYSFGITRSRLYVNGDEKTRGLYEVNSMVPTNYGYKLMLLNPRNPANRGHLKVIINKYMEAEAIVFKKESKSNEIIFHIPDAPKPLLKKEKKYFTDLGEVTVEDADSLWGMTFHPYIRLDQRAGLQGRLYEVDSTSITFEEVITIKEKKKKKKKKKSKKRKKRKKKEKEKVEETEDENTSEENEEETESENEEIEEQEEVENIEAPQPEEEEVVVKRKITKTYFVKVRSILKFEDGTVKDKEWTFPVKEIQEREDESAGKQEERFQMAIKTKGKKEIYLYLNGDRTVSSFEADGMLYLMRGH